MTVCDVELCIARKTSVVLKHSPLKLEGEPRWSLDRRDDPAASSRPGVGLGRVRGRGRGLHVFLLSEGGAVEVSNHGPAVAP